MRTSGTTVSAGLQPAALTRPGSSGPVTEIAVLIASRNGAATIGDTVRSARTQFREAASGGPEPLTLDVYVVSDGSADDTAQVALAAGARVLDLVENVGKPAAIYRAVHDLGLLDSYDFLAILDDDTVIAPRFVAESLERFDERTAIVVGKTITNWTHEHRWNPWLAARAYSYWRYQVTIRPGQDAFNALNCISGSNSMYRTDLLREVLVESTPYIVDDTYWLLETQRRKLGRVRYAPDAHAYIQDPTTFPEWYKQNLRWLWGTCQGIIGHRVGRQRSWFDFWYGTLILDWILYVVFWPIIAVVVVVNHWMSLETMLVAVGGMYLLWTTAAAIALRKWRLVVLTPFIFVFDWIYRVNFVHAAVKAVRQPVVSSCRWDSPTRYQPERS